MKRYALKSLWFIIPVLASLLIVFTCEFQNPAEHLRLIINFQTVDTYISVSFYDAATLEALDDRTIDVSFEGQDKDLVVDVENQSIFNLRTDKGLAEFGILKEYEPSVEMPVKLRIVANANGYLTSSVPVFIDTAGAYTYDMVLVKKDAPPQGVAVEINREISTDANGSTTQEIRVETEAEPITGAAMSITVPQGTQITDQNGQPLQGQITTEVTQFNSETDQSLNSFPGGFTVDVASNPDGQEESGEFVTAGFVAIDITDENGRQAENFSEPIEIRMELAPGFTHPDTGEEVQVGDEIPVWSYDSETGEWTYEGQGTVVGPNANGMLEVVYQVSHLSWWNLDFFWNSCRYGIWVDIVGRSACDPCLYFGLEITRGSKVIRRKVGRICDDVIKFYMVPQGTGARLRAYMGYMDWFYDRNPVGETTIANLCDQVPYPSSSTAKRTSITVTLPSTGFHKIFKFVGVCPGKDDVEVRPSLPLYISNDVTPQQYQYLGWVRNGEIELCNLVVPGSYWFRTTYRGETYEAKCTINADYTLTLDYSETIVVTQSGLYVTYTVNLPAETCAEL